MNSFSVPTSLSKFARRTHLFLLCAALLLVIPAGVRAQQPDEVIKWHYQDQSRLAEFESLALEQNVINWVLARSQVVELQTTFADLTGAPG